MYDHWKSANAVPIPIRSRATTSHGPNCTSILDIDYWISKPEEILSRTWVRVSKEYRTCAVYYYASLPANPDGPTGPDTHGALRVEEVGDILYIKLADGEVVDVGDDELENVLHNIDRYL